MTNAALLLFLILGSAKKDALPDYAAETSRISIDQPLDAFDSMIEASAQPRAGAMKVNLSNLIVRAYTRRVPQVSLNDHTLVLVVTAVESVASGIEHSAAFHISSQDLMFRQLQKVEVDYDKFQVTITTSVVDVDEKKSEKTTVIDLKIVPSKKANAGYVIDLAELR
ncbi:MAG: hypothetical protein AAF585_10265 [Verrucomicrobiota bacterium]